MSDATGNTTANSSSAGQPPPDSTTTSSTNNTNKKQQPSINTTDDGTDAPDPCNLIVNYVPTPVTDAELNNLFAPFGSLISARVIVDRHTKHPKGYGFVKYRDRTSAEQAIEKMNGHDILGKRLKVTPARGHQAAQINEYLDRGGGGKPSPSSIDAPPHSSVHHAMPTKQPKSPDTKSSTTAPPPYAISGGPSSTATTATNNATGMPQAPPGYSYQPVSHFPQYTTGPNGELLMLVPNSSSGHPPSNTTGPHHHVHHHHHHHQAVPTPTTASTFAHHQHQHQQHQPVYQHHPTAAFVPQPFHHQQHQHHHLQQQQQNISHHPHHPVMYPSTASLGSTTSNAPPTFSLDLSMETKSNSTNAPSNTTSGGVVAPPPVPTTASAHPLSLPTALPPGAVHHLAPGQAPPPGFVPMVPMHHQHHQHTHHHHHHHHNPASWQSDTHGSSQ